MNHSLGIRNLEIASNTESSRYHSVAVCERSIARTWTRPMPDHSRDYCDFTSAISGDDLARIAAFEPADPNIKRVGEQSGLWSDVRRGSQAVAA